MTTTHTHVVTPYLSPYVRCEKCGVVVTGYISYLGQVEDCNHVGENVPCGHNADPESVCPTWDPDHGCTCVKQYGEREHELAEGDSDG